MKNPKVTNQTSDETTSADESNVFTSGKSVHITSHAPRRRAGFLFGPEPTIIVVAELSKDQAEALIGDPQLTIKAFTPEVANEI